jgi:dTDP-4-dehydrorhamnose 3,5-epimerase
MINGVSLHDEKHIIVPKGDIYHAIKSTDDGFCGFGEAYFSEIECGQVKGWKRHNRMTLNIVVPVGAIKFVIYDDRESSSTKGSFQEVILSVKDNYQRLTVPAGLWMAFVGLGEGVSMLMDIIPELHDDSESSKRCLDDIPYDFHF